MTVCPSLVLRASLRGVDAVPGSQREGRGRCRGLQAAGPQNSHVPSPYAHLLPAVGVRLSPWPLTSGPWAELLLLRCRGLDTAFPAEMPRLKNHACAPGQDLEASGCPRSLPRCPPHHSTICILLPWTWDTGGAEQGKILALPYAAGILGQQPCLYQCHFLKWAHLGAVTVA